jgi:dynactin 5
MRILLLPQGKFTIIKDCTKIADNTIIPPNTVIPALTRFAGSPGAQRGITKKKLSTSCSLDIGHFVEDLPESTQEVVEAHTKSYYARFQPAER